MENKVTVRGRAGFTLIEVLVTLILLAVLAAAVFPVVTQQAESGDPVKAAQDLSSIRTGIETFQLNVRPSLPGDLEDLVYRISNTQDAPIQNTVATSGYSSNQATNKWDGPYLDVPLTQGSIATTEVAFETGYGGQVLSDLTCYNAVATPNVDETTTCDKATDFVAVKITGLSDAQFESLNDLIDGEAESDANSPISGKIRYLDVAGGGNTALTLDSNETVFYLTVPYR